MDRFIPARSALDMDVASFNLLKENASTAAAPSPAKVLPAPPTDLHDASCFMIASAAWSSAESCNCGRCAGRVREAASGGLWHGGRQLAHSGLQE